MGKFGIQLQLLSLMGSPCHEGKNPFKFHPKKGRLPLFNFIMKESFECPFPGTLFEYTMFTFPGFRGPWTQPFLPLESDYSFRIGLSKLDNGDFLNPPFSLGLLSLGGKFSLRAGNQKNPGPFSKLRSFLEALIPSFLKGPKALEVLYLFFVPQQIYWHLFKKPFYAVVPLAGSTPFRVFPVISSSMEGLHLPISPLPWKAYPPLPPS